MRILLILSGFIIVSTGIGLKVYSLQLNLTPSMPLGFYRVAEISAIKHGAIVSICLPDEIAKEGLRQGYLTKGKCANGSIPVVKQVIAIPGDNVELSYQGITVNGKFHLAPFRFADHNGVAIKQFVGYGKYSNTQGYWLYGSHAPLDSWDSRYFGAVARENIVNVVKPVLVLGLAVGVAGTVMLANQRSIKPYPFIIHGEHVLTSTEESQAAVEHLKPQLANVLAKGFIKNLRRVSTDKHVNRERQMATLAVTNQEALAVTQKYFQQHQADKIAKKQVNDVKITSSLQSSEHTMVIRWQETWRTPNTGEVLKQEHYVAEVMYQFDTPSTHELVLKHNPLGFYITHLSWSLEKVN